MQLENRNRTVERAIFSDLWCELGEKNEPEIAADFREFVYEAL
jgi:hypothetical protein